MTGGGERANDAGPAEPIRTGRRPVVWAVLGMLAGAALGLVTGLVWMALADPATFGDLAAAAVTIVALVPSGLIIGGLAGFFLARRRAA